MLIYILRNIISIRLDFLLGRAFSIVHSHGGKYVRANGSLSQHIATYRFKVEKEDNYTIWIEALGTSFKDNSVSFYIDDNRQRTVHLVVFLKETAWIWNCLNKKVGIALSILAVGEEEIERFFCNCLFLFLFPMYKQ